MKNKLLLSLAALMVLASCSTRIELVKRKYNKGYYVSVTKKHQNVEQASAQPSRMVKQKASDSPALPVEILMPETAKPALTVTKPQADKNQRTQATPVRLAGLKHGHKKAEPAAPTALASSQNHPATQSKSIRPMVPNNEMGSRKGADSDTNTILLVILCLFWWLDLVAVYLHENKKITMNFWITLLLDLTFILGVVYAILVVLDVISFA